MSWLSSCQSTNSSVGVNPHGSTNNVKLLLNSSPLEPPTWCAKCRIGFMTLPPVLLPKHPVVVLLLKRALVSWSLAIDEHGGHEDLCGSGRRSVIPYVHGRTGLYCSSLPCLCEPEPFSTPVKWHLPEPLIAQGRTVTMSPEARQVASG
jgi:hypothetical protein